jgi:CheY-like chemotaxis protein
MAKILYVEDNDDNVYMLSARLRRKGHEVIIATDGEQGLVRASRDMPALIIMDLSLPVLNGWETTRRLKASSATSGIPVIALSSHVMPGDREAALAAGCDDYDTKPVEFARLLQKIETLLSQRRP